MSYPIHRKSVEVLSIIIFLTVLYAYPSFAGPVDECVLAQATPQRSAEEEERPQSVSDLPDLEIDDSGSELAEVVPESVPSYQYSSFASEDALLSSSSSNFAAFDSPTDASSPMIGSATALTADVSGGPVGVLAISLTGLLFAAIGIAVRDSYLRRTDVANQDGTEANDSGSAVAA